MNARQDPSRGHSFKVEDGTVVAEYYHFGEDVDYEFAVLIRLDQAGQERMATALGLPGTPAPEELAQVLKERFVTHYAARDFADEHGVPYTYERDFWP